MSIGGRPALAILALAACGGDEARAPTPLERAIVASLGQRLGVPVGAHCAGDTRCAAMLLDGTFLPITVEHAAGRDVEWRVDGLLITTDELEAYLRDEVAELGARQRVTCAPRIRKIAPGERIACDLERGGVVFVTVRADGSTSVETLLEREAAAARGVLTPAIEEELARASREAETVGDAEEAEEAAEGDEAAAPR